MKRKPTFDEYISGCEEFAQPILRFIRECMHEVNPSIKEEIKWNFPCFIHNGSILANMAGFKKHATLGFWMASEMKDPNNIFVHGENKGMGNFGKITSLEDLPNKEVLKAYVIEAMQLHDQGVKISPSVNKKAIPDNELLLSALRASEVAQTIFTNFSPSHQGEYHEWISEGKPRNWKYMKSWKGKA